MPLQDLPEQPRQNVHDTEKLMVQPNAASPTEMLLLRVVVVLVVVAAVLVGFTFLRGLG